MGAANARQPAFDEPGGPHKADPMSCLEGAGSVNSGLNKQDKLLLDSMRGFDGS